MPRGSAPLCRQMGTVVLLALASGCDLDPTHPQARITTASPLPDAVVGVYYDEAVSSLRADGTAGNPNWSLRADSGPVPDGLSFCAGTTPAECTAGSIRGTPTRAGIWSFIVQVDDDWNSDSKTFTLTVNPAPGGKGTLHFTWTVNGGLGQCSDRQVRLAAGSFSTTRPCSDGAFDAVDLPSGTYSPILTLLDAQGREIGAATPASPTPAFLSGGTTVQVSADLSPFGGSVGVSWTIDGQPPATTCAGSGIGAIAVSFGVGGRFSSDIEVPCTDGSHVFTELIAAVSTVRATPLRTDGTCFKRADQSCLGTSTSVTVPASGRADVSVVIPPTTGSISVSWTIDRVTPTQAICDQKNLLSVGIETVAVDGPRFITYILPCHDGSGTIVVPGGLSYVLEANLETSSATVDHQATRAIFVDYGAVAVAPLLEFTTGTTTTCATTGGTVEPQTIAVDTTWTKVGSPHRVPPTFAVANGAVLTIQAGSVVCIPEGEAFRVGTNGTAAMLHVAGTTDDPVVFRGDPDGSFWGGIVIAVNSDPRIQTFVSGARILNGSLQAGGSVVIDDTRFEHGSTVVLGQNNGSYSLTNSTVVGSIGPGVQVWGPPLGFVENVRVAGGDGVGIDVFTSSFGIVNSEVSGNASDGIFVEGGLSGGTGVGISGSNLFDNGGVGISTQSTGVLVDATGNYWGDPAGPNGTNGDGVGSGVRVGGFVTDPFAVGPFP